MNAMKSLRNLSLASTMTVKKASLPALRLPQIDIDALYGGQSPGGDGCIDAPGTQRKPDPPEEIVAKLRQVDVLVSQ